MTAIHPRLIISALFSILPLGAIPVFIGTTTGHGPGASKGILRADFDPTSGKLTPPQLAAEYRQPGFLAIHPEKPILYAIGAPRKPFADGSSSVAAFAIGGDLALTFLGEAPTGGKGVCHLAVDPSGRTLAVANYGDGSFATLRLDERGLPQQPPASVIANSGSGPDKQRQEAAHAHGVYFNKAGDRLFVPDLGLDRVWVHAFDPATSKLGERTSIPTAAGAGPRHMAFSADESRAFIINELNATVLVARRNDKGDYQPESTAATLPEGFSGPNTTAEIELSPDGKFVYASNRGHDSIVVFRRDDGRLVPIQHAPCGGKHPRHFKLSPCGKWLLCAHMDSNTISVLPRDPATGKLGAATLTVPAPGAICILFYQPKAG